MKGLFFSFVALVPPFFGFFTTADSRIACAKELFALTVQIFVISHLVTAEPGSPSRLPVYVHFCFHKGNSETPQYRPQRSPPPAQSARHHRGGRPEAVLVFKPDIVIVQNSRLQIPA